MRRRPAIGPTAIGRSRRGRLGIAIAVVALGLAACSRPEPAAEPVRAVRTVVVAPQSTGTELSFAAEIRPRVETRLGFRVPGKMTARSVDLGARVRAGQVLARLDPIDFRLGQDASRAALASAAASLEQAELDHARHRDLRAQGFISGAELERRETALKVVMPRDCAARERLREAMPGILAGAAGEPVK